MIASTILRIARVRRRGSRLIAPTVGAFAAGAAAAGAAMLLLNPSSERRSRNRTRPRTRTQLGPQGSDVLSGDLPGSVGGLSAGATGEGRSDQAAAGEEEGR